MASRSARLAVALLCSAAFAAACVTQDPGSDPNAPGYVGGALDAENLALAGGQGVGVWLWTVQNEGGSHHALADRLAKLGATRIYVKVADGRHLWPEASDARICDAYHGRGIQCFGWSYNYPQDAADQAQAITSAIQNGYDGYVLDIESEFDGQKTVLRDVLSAFHDARAAAGRSSSSFPLYATTWANPKDHNFHVEIVDEYVDAHLPQVYLEVWGRRYLDDPAGTVKTAVAEYRSLGAKKPIHGIVSTEHAIITAQEINLFLGESGPESSIWRVPGDGTPQSIWDTWAKVDWHHFNKQAAAQVVISNPPANSMQSGEVNFTVAPDPKVSRVTWYAEGTNFLGDSYDRSSGFSLPYTMNTAGNRTIIAKGYDETGHIVGSGSVKFAYQAPNGVSFLLPLAGSSNRNGVTFSVFATPSVASVGYYAEDYYPLGESTDAANGFPVTYSFKLLGDRAVTARAYDKDGYEIADADVSFTIQPSGTLQFGFPAQDATVPSAMTLKAGGQPGVTQVHYFSTDDSELGFSSDAANGFPLDWQFEEPGPQTVTAHGLDDAGNELSVQAVDFVVDDGGN